MATEVIMPVLGLTMESGTIVEWIKQEGDSVTEGEILFTVETDKSVMEVEAKASGNLIKVLNGPGDEVPIQQVIGYIGEAGEVVADIPAASGKGATSEGALSPPPEKAPAVPAVSDRAGGRIKSSPAARNYAKDLDIAIEDVTGTGPGGRIVRADIKAFAEARAQTPEPVPATPSVGPLPTIAYDTGKQERSRTPLTGIRKIAATRLAESTSTVPHFYLSMDLDMTKAVALRHELIQYGESNSLARVSINDLIIKAVAMALKESPAVNASLEGDTIIQYEDVNIGFAIALDDGLVVPVVGGADRRTVYDIAEATKALDGKAKGSGLSPDDYGHGTFTISNLGMFGVDHFTAIINPPEGAILAVGRVKEKPVVVDGAVEVRDMMTATLSSDHRLIDGAVAAQFMARVRKILEEPIGLLVKDLSRLGDGSE